MTFIFPFFSVTVAVILTYIPHFIRVALGQRRGTYDNANPRDNTKVDEQDKEFADLQKRLLGAHQNQLESIGVYAAGVVAMVFRRGYTTWSVNYLCAQYLVFRVAYITAYIAPPVAKGYVRTLTFVGCFATIMIIWIRAWV